MTWLDMLLVGVAFILVGAAFFQDSLSSAVNTLIQQWDMLQEALGV